MIRHVLALLLGLAAAGCSGGDAPGPAKEPAATPAPAGAREVKRLAAPSAGYPLKTCVVSGEELGGMGPPVAVSYDGTEVQFCCADCIGKFTADPEKYVALVRAAKK